MPKCEDAMAVALRVLSAVIHHENLDPGDVARLRSYSPDAAPQVPLDELACDLIQKKLKVCFFQPAEGPREDFVLGSRRFRRLEQAVGGRDVRSTV